MPIKIAIDARLIDRPMTGDSTYWRGLVKALAQTQPEAELLLFTNDQPAASIPESAKVRWVRVPGSGRFWSLAWFPLAARRSRASVVHTQYTLSPLVGDRGVSTVHDVSFFIGPQWFRPKDRWLLRLSVPSSCRRAAKVVTVSETSRREIERFVPEAKGKTIVTPLALGDGIRPMPPDLARATVAGMGVEEPYLLTVGTRWPRKNMALAVKAARMADKRLVVTGKSGWGEEDGALTATGYVGDAELTALYQRASLYLAPAWHEGFGIPLLEAFACQCPVLASCGGALPETAGEAAEIVPSFEPADWADRIRALLADSSKLDSMRRLGLERLGSFDWAKTARLTFDAYREVAQS
ncbi:MAG: glycosyltransferase family 4 protein [Fimbriimonadaceae bacterium]|nr:glycosyltransferase family 4 protein [Fimbriimonadaceae bacterium]QYK57803.1 MAG: glycosyltransferase family 4 protein [Fimbriimonadaceae bacterium]